MMDVWKGGTFMIHQTVFKRYELKYMLTTAQKEIIVKAMEPYMLLDSFGRHNIRNLYLDTDSYRLIRRSIEKPRYKEKLRIRGYTDLDPDTAVFVEVKKKYKHVVYKRRLSMPESDALQWISGHSPSPVKSQIANEVDYFLHFYGNLAPKVFLSYDREAYYSKNGDDFRVTFDDHILCRQEELTLKSEAWGTPILEDGLVLMELKVSGGIPLWMTKVLSENHIYKTSFSKYGTAYRTLIFPQLKEEVFNEYII